MASCMGDKQDTHLAGGCGSVIECLTIKRVFNHHAMCIHIQSHGVKKKKTFMIPQAQDDLKAFHHLYFHNPLPPELYLRKKK